MVNLFSQLSRVPGCDRPISQYESVCTNSKDGGKVDLTRAEEGFWQAIYEIGRQRY